LFLFNDILTALQEEESLIVQKILSVQPDIMTPRVSLLNLSVKKICTFLFRG